MNEIVCRSLSLWCCLSLPFFVVLLRFPPLCCTCKRLACILPWATGRDLNDRSLDFNSSLLLFGTTRRVEKSTFPRKTLRHVCNYSLRRMYMQIKGETDLCPLCIRLDTICIVIKCQPRVARLPFFEHSNRFRRLFLSLP